MRLVCVLLLIVGELSSALALDARKALTQYSRTVWTQQDGLPQDAVRTITQTPDGYLWLGTDEGLARFDGYEFVIFSKDQGGLPSNSITSLAAGKDGSLWIGTPQGVTRYRDGRFQTYTHKDGLPAGAVDSILIDHNGWLWMVVAGNLSRFDGAQFTNFVLGQDIPMQRVRAVAEDDGHHIYAAGYSAVARFENGRFSTVVGPDTVGADFPLAVRVDHGGTIWILGTRGVIARSPDGAIRRYEAGNGMPESFGLNGALELDRDGNVWVGTAGGVARLEGTHFQTRTGVEADDERTSVRSIFEDREGNLWLGTTNGLVRMHDDLFTIYGKTEGLPSNEPNAVHQDAKGRTWIGFLDGGLVLFAGGPRTANMPGGGVFSIRETRGGELLVAGRDGLARLSGDRFRPFVPPDPLGRKSVYDVAADSAGRIWLALPSGLGVLEGDRYRTVLGPGTEADASVFTLAEGSGGAMWAGSFRIGLWRITANEKRLFTVADGLGSNQVHALHQDGEGTLWIGTFGGGLNALRHGRFVRYTAKDGLPSDNISNILDDGHSLWLSTTRGICQISKEELSEFADHRITALHPVNYGAADGLRGAQGSSNISGGGDRHNDGSLWFVTSRGVAVYEPSARKRVTLAPPVHLLEMISDGKEQDWTQSPRLPAGSGRLQVRYTAIHLSAPDRVQYAYKLEGLDPDWIEAGRRRGVTYDNLRPGHYRFFVHAALPGAAPSESSYEFDVLPHLYQTAWFRLLLALMLAAMGWLVYRLRMRQVRSGFAAVLQERARLAREIHDTLTQAFVGIASQLDVVEMRMPKDALPARSSLELARRMAQHSLTEARRAVMDLRAAALDEQDLATALKSGVGLWTANSGVNVDVQVSGESANLPEDVAHQVLRIAQEAVNNALKHSGADRVDLNLHVDEKRLKLHVVDNGLGFEPNGVFTTTNGHFGIIGMRERAQRLGGELSLDSRPGEGTRLDVTVPLP